MTTITSNVFQATVQTEDVWYVDASRPDDSGNGLTPATAKKTITAGLSLLNSGETLEIAGGSYTEANMLGNGIPNGTDANNLTTIRGAAGQTVTWNSPTNASQWRQVLLGGSPTVNIKSYIAFENIIFDASTSQYNGLWGCMWIEGPSNNIHLTDCTFTNATTGVAPLVISDPASFQPVRSIGGHVLTRCTFSNSGDSAFDHGIYCQHVNVTLIDCVAFGNSGWGFHCFNNEVASDNNVLDGCVSYNNGQGGILVDGSNCVIKNCIVHDEGEGIIFFSGTTNGKAYHNTVVNCTIGIKTWASTSGTESKNNILYGNATNYGGDKSPDTVANDFTSNPSFVDGVGPSYDFHLQSGSAARNYGTNLLSDVPDDKDGVSRDSIPDAGAYEYV